MLERFGRGWKMAKASWAIVKLHPKLLLFPTLSGIALLILAVLVGVSIFAGFGVEQIKNLPTKEDPGALVKYLILIPIYFVCSFVIVFFNSALIFSSLQCFEGKEPSLAGGLAKAASRLPQILGWALVASTVGVALQALKNVLEDKLGSIAGGLIGGLGDMVWGIATYFVAPVVVVEGVGPIEAIKRSSALMRRTWGEAVAGEGGLSLIAILLILPLAAVFGAALPAVGQDVARLLVVAIGIYLVVLTVIFSTLSTIFSTSVYVYASTGNAPSSMDPALLQGAFRKK